MNQYIERFNTGETGQRVQIEYLHPTACTRRC